MGIICALGQPDRQLDWVFPVMFGAIAFAFIIGTITTVNPCGLVLLPAYFAHRLGAETDPDGNKLDAVFRAIPIGISATAGFVLVFAIIGGATVLGAHWLTQVFPWAGLIIGLILTALGLYILSGRRITVPWPRTKHHATRNNLRGDFAYGAGYAIISLSCTLPIFLAILGTSVTETASLSVLNFIAFTLGVGTILTALSVSAALTRNGLAVTLKRFLPYTHQLGGAVLFLAGLYVTYLLGSALFAAEAPVDNMLAAGEQFSAIFIIWLSGPVGKIITPVVLALLITTFIGSYFYHRRRRK